MSELIGISLSHKEKVAPDNVEYGIFFDLVRVFDWRTEPISGELAFETLEKYRSILIGEPHSHFTDLELLAVREWIITGGNLLIMAGCSGDAAPGADAASYSNIGKLFEFITFPDNCLGIDLGVTRGQPFDTKVQVEISNLVGISAKLCYDTGCVFRLSPTTEIEIISNLKVPINSSIVTGVRISGTNVSAANPYPQKADGSLLTRFKWEKGIVTVIGSSFSFKDDTIIRESNVLFTNWLITTSFPTIIKNYIDDYSDKPQRHRLLHGYPFPNLMTKIENHEHIDQVFNGLSIDTGKPIIIGILPHTFCNPMVKGCGFCTFPHESFNKSCVKETVLNASMELADFNKKFDTFQNSPVQAIYFGGGTANLTPHNEFEILCNNLSNSFNCGSSEVTLEGVARYFSTDNYRYLDILQTSFNFENLRLSIGVQTFDKTLLHKMGRQNFGDSECIGTLAKESKKRKIEISGDLLFNLPNESIEMMKSDISALVDMGFNQISIYHLVLFRGLGPEWSKDKDIISALPVNSIALENWLILREMLLTQGYEQRTLTNFQKPLSKPFIYEECVYQPEKYNWLGFGPSAISVFHDDQFDRAVKLINHETANQYNNNEGWEKYYLFDQLDMKVLFITRRIALLNIDKEKYRDLFNTHIENDFSAEIYFLSERGLIQNLNDKITITPEGMFYADTIAGVFSLRKAKYNRMMNLIKNKTVEPEEYFFSTQYSPRMG
jgi:oxygen-independent coproporphyrinogen-3 oxidase